VQRFEVGIEIVGLIMATPRALPPACFNCVQRQGTFSERRGEPDRRCGRLELLPAQYRKKFWHLLGDTIANVNSRSRCTEHRQRGAFDQRARVGAIKGSASRPSSATINGTGWTLKSMVCKHGDKSNRAIAASVAAHPPQGAMPHRRRILRRQTGRPHTSHRERVCHEN